MIGVIMTDYELWIVDSVADRIKMFIKRYGCEPTIVVLEKCYEHLGFTAIDGICVTYTPLPIGILVY